MPEGEGMGIFPPFRGMADKERGGIPAVDHRKGKRFAAIAAPAEGTGGGHVMGNDTGLSIHDENGKRQVLVKYLGKAGHRARPSAWRSHRHGAQTRQKLR